jgi:hypothetical protein
MVIGTVEEKIQATEYVNTFITIFIFSLLLFIVNNRDYFVSNSVHRNTNTCQRHDLHLPQVSLAMHQNAVYYSAIKIFNILPKAIKNISSKPKKFKITLNNICKLTHFTV